MLGFVRGILWSNRKFFTMWYLAKMRLNNDILWFVWDLETFNKIHFKLLIKNFIKRTPSSPYPEHKFLLMSTFTEYFEPYFGSS